MPGNTTIGIDGDAWTINGAPTYPGRYFGKHRIEGLLLNSRMTNAIFDDANPATRQLWAYPDTGVWDADRNTDEFIDALPEHRAHGILAVTVNMQGGCPTSYYRLEKFRNIMQQRGIPIDADVVWQGLPSPESQPWNNAAYTPDGELLPAYRNRADRVLDACDAIGMIVVLGCFYFGQDERLRNQSAVIRAVNQVCHWLREARHTNVLLEINNETNVPRYEHDILQPHRVHELILHAKQRTDAPVGTSYGGGRIPDDSVIAASDYIMLHGNGVTQPARIAEMVRQTRAMPAYTEAPLPKPIMFTEDDHYDFDAPQNNYLAAISEYASWGYFDAADAAGGDSEFSDYHHGYQNVPINWRVNTPRKQGWLGLTGQVVGV